MPFRVLITGIAGFAGSHLAERAIAAGHQVHGVVHEPSPHANLSAVAQRITLHDGDITDAGSFERVLAAADPDVVIHLAAQPVPSIAARDPRASIQVNVVGTAHVAHAVAARPGTRLVFASSAEVYDPEAPVPWTEDSPVRAPNVYAATKVAAEAIVREVGDRGIAAVTIVRPGNQLGPRLHADLVTSAFARQVALAELGQGEAVIRHGRLDARRDLIDVRDMADAYLAVAARKRPGSALLNAGSGEPVTIEQVLATLVRLARVPLRTELDQTRVRGGDPSVISIDSSRLTRETGWRPRIALERSLADTLQYWRERVASETPAMPR